MPTLGANVAVLDAGRVLLVRSADIGLWLLPGGRADDGESIASCAVREVREESGLEVRLTRLAGVYSMPRWMRHGHHSHHIVLFAAESVGGELMHGTDGETLDARYFSPDALPDDLVWWHRRRIADALVSTAQCAVWTQDVVWPFEQMLTTEARKRLPAAEFERLRSSMMEQPHAESERRDV